MLTAHLVMKMDPTYTAIGEKYMKNPQRFANPFVRAWLELTHLDMKLRLWLLGSLVPKEEFVWQDLNSSFIRSVVSKQDIPFLKRAIEGEVLLFKSLLLLYGLPLRRSVVRTTGEVLMELG